MTRFIRGVDDFTQDFGGIGASDAKMPHPWDKVGSPYS